MLKKKIYDGHVIYILLGLFVCLFVSLSLPVVRFSQLLCYADKHIVNIMKIYRISKGTTYKSN